MKKNLIAVVLLFPLSLYAEEEQKNDSLRTIQLNEINIYSHKETMPQQMPVSYTIITPNLINGAQFNTIKELSIYVPNFFIPEYGSAMSTAPYIRGVGSRSTGQTIALYVDNVPYFEKTTFDFDFYDIMQINVLRGPQGTLYGRNAMGGVVNIYTLSPLIYQGTKLSVAGGNYGSVRAQAAHYAKFNSKMGFSLSGYYNHRNGFFTNTYTGKDADDKTSVGGRAKFDWQINSQWKMQYILNYDYIEQTAFPYGLYDKTTGEVANPNFNDPGAYNRSMVTNSLFIEHQNDKILFSSSTSHQYFSDDMKMDQDFTPLSFFSLEQIQKQHAVNEEFTLKSNTKNNYQWSFGLTSFYQKLDMNAPVAFKKDAITQILQPAFDRAAIQGAPEMIITSEQMDIPGIYNTETYGGALFHQSTYNNLFVKGFSITAGLRGDFEKVKLDYNTNTSLNINMKMGNTTRPVTLVDTLKGKESKLFSEVLPKVALKYTWNENQYIYGNISRGYKAGGFNVQMFSDLMQKDLMNSGNPNAPKTDVRKSILYYPEYSWNYEIGFQGTIWKNRIKTQISLFYMDIDSIQLTKFVPSGNGRMITNAGKAKSKGIELSTQANLGKGFSATINYGYAHAIFTNYIDSVAMNGNFQQADYKGKYVPYAPQQTLCLGGSYVHLFKHAFIDQFMANAQFLGVGKIYWNEANTLSQKFYTLVNAKVGIRKGDVGLDVWAKNLFNTSYNAFYFESFGNSFFQKGNPLQCGMTLKLEF